MSIDLNAPEVQEALKAAIEEQTRGLLEKNKELLGEVKKLKRGQEINPADYEALQNELDSTKDRLSEAQKIVKTTQTEFEKVKKMYEAESGYTNNLLVENGLNEALVKEGVKKEFLPAVKSMLKSQVQVKVEGDARKALIGDKALSDYVSEWSKSEEGKHFIAAPANSGGGSQGGGNASGGGKSMPRSQFDSMKPGEQAAYMKSGGKLTD
jgi:hypothetical protein